MKFKAFDAPYLEGLRAGDPATEKHFVSYFSELMRLKLRSRVRSIDAMEDVKQETFARALALIRSGSGVRQPERLGALVNSICNNVLLEYYRASDRDQWQSNSDAASELIDYGPSGQSIVEAAQAEQVVGKILKELSTRDQRLLQSLLIDECNADSVCDEFGISRDYLRVLVFRAKQSFKEVFLKQIGAAD